MTILAVLLTILIGIFAGWLLGLILKSRHEYWMLCLTGLIGSFVGFTITKIYGFSGNLDLTIIFDICSTCILFIIIRILLGKKF